MTKEELLELNEIFVVVVDNPMDAITHLTLKLTDVLRNRVIGIGLFKSCFRMEKQEFIIVMMKLNIKLGLII